MKTHKTIHQLIHALLVSGLLAITLLWALPVQAQEPEQEQQQEEAEDKAERAAFESAYLIDNPSALVYNAKTLEMVIQHRFGLVDNGFSDVFGIYGPANIRMGFTYAPIEKLNVGFGYTKNKQYLDLNAKYGILSQTRSGSMPVSVVYYGNVAFDLRSSDNFLNTSDQISYYHSVIVAHRINRTFSVQVTPSLSHFNAVDAFVNLEGEIEGLMNNNHFAVSTVGRAKFSPQSSIIVGWDQPLTKHTQNNPSPNLSLGVEIATSSHAFQVFFANYAGIVPQENHVFNQNDFTDGDFLIGFNITRLWSF